MNGDMAVAQKGPTRVTFAQSALAPVLVDLTTVSGQRFQSRVVGLYYYSTTSGKTVPVASVKDAPGVLYPPNQVVYPDAFDGHGVKADIRYVYTHYAFAQDIVITDPASLPSPADLGLDPATTRVQVCTAFSQSPTPTIKQGLLKREPDSQRRQSLVSPDLTDDILEFADGSADVRFPTGQAFVWDSGAAPAPGQPWKVQLPEMSKLGTILVGKHWISGPGNSAMLVESTDYLDLAAALSRTPSAAPAGKKGATALLQPDSRRAEARSNRAFVVAQQPYSPRGVVLDYYVSLSGSQTTYNFLANTTYYIANIILME